MTSSGQAGVVVALAAARSQRRRTYGRRGAQRGPRRRLFVAPEPGDPHQARPQLRRRERHRGAPRGSAAVASAVQTKHESAAEVVSLMQAEIDRLMTQPVGVEELAARKLDADRRLQPQRRDDRGTGRLRSAPWSSPTGLPAELKTRIEAIEAVGAGRRPALCRGAARREPPAHCRRRRGGRLRQGAAGEPARRGDGGPGRARRRARRRSQPTLGALATTRRRGTQVSHPPRTVGEGKPFVSAIGFTGTIVPPQTAHASRIRRPPTLIRCPPYDRPSLRFPVQRASRRCAYLGSRRFRIECRPSSCARRRPSTSPPGRPASRASSR